MVLLKKRPDRLWRFNRLPWISLYFLHMDITKQNVVSDWPLCHIQTVNYGSSRTITYNDYPAINRVSRRNTFAAAAIQTLTFPFILQLSPVRRVANHTSRLGTYADDRHIAGQTSPPYRTIHHQSIIDGTGMWAHLSPLPPLDITATPSLAR